ncbi:hypothetical protein PF010_g27365 [Phytophthora fragariae]|uniref:Uncharacterized protein n=1 Tax=Phytophthora fragariae TaxID=53985 RepID=A0A6A3QKM1_9STRA|nr:hypothetical protein PF007_g31587 [Phytophthora fragariae]KAE9067688.1 hypothetical protein PF010_g27365 [Phytophthora fragariae]KAE9078439.1 hypothetical protein PF006_g27720 [Phytophthora fragariae]KAE9282811.1 hypothetical protein PF008_g27565 [Phytophthora fragariae]
MDDHMPEQDPSKVKGDGLVRWLDLSACLPIL